MQGARSGRSTGAADAGGVGACGQVNAAPLVTATGGHGGVDAAFTALGMAERHATILIDPASELDAPDRP